MPRGNPGGNPDILEASAKARKEDARKRTNQAIAELFKNGSEITFKKVADAAGVSVAYLYKHDDIKEQIQYLRNQQKQANRERKAKPKSFQSASDRSRTLVNEKLKEINKQLRAEIDSQRLQIKKMAGKLTELSAVEEENLRLRQQLDKLDTELKSTKAELDRYLRNNPTAHPKVTSIDTRRVNDRDAAINREELKELLSNLDVGITPKLYEIAKEKSKEKVKNALLAVQEYISTGKSVKSKMGLIIRAIEEEWIPNLSESERTLARETENFSEWFKLAQKHGYVLASQGTTKGIIVLEKATNEWISWQEMIEKGVTLNHLENRN